MQKNRLYSTIAAIIAASLALPGIAAEQNGKSQARQLDIGSQLSEVDRLLTDAERSSGNVPQAAGYLRQARMLFNKARADYSAFLATQTAKAGSSKPYNPFPYELQRDRNGRLIPRPPENSGPAAGIDDWSAQMKSVIGKINAIRSGNNADLSQQVENELKIFGNPADAHCGAGIQRPATRDVYDTPVVGLLRNPCSDPLNDFGASEYQQKRQRDESYKYADMSAADLDALAARYSDNPEIQKAIAKLKAVQSAENKLGAQATHIDNVAFSKDYELKKGNKDAAKSAEIIGDLTFDIPKGWTEVQEDSKPLPEWILKDGSSRASELGAKNFAETISKGVTKPVEGFMAIPELFDLYDKSDSAGEHYVAAGTYNAELKTSGGRTPALTKWDTARNKTLDASAELHRLIQAELQRKKEKTATH